MTSKEDIFLPNLRKVCMSLLDDIESFLARTNMGAAYLGKAAVGNSELVFRLRRGGRVWPETEARLREFMARRRVNQVGDREASHLEAAE